MARGGGDDRLPLLGGAYQARSFIAEAQRCVNLYPEINPKDAPTPVTHYLTPGIVELSQPEVDVVRALYRASNGGLYAVIGETLYSINADFTGTAMGLINPGTGPVSIADNGIVGIVVDGTRFGYWFVIGGGTVFTITDTAFYGADRACFLDGFFVLNRPSTNQFYISPYYWDGIEPFDPLDIAAKTGSPDVIISIAVIHRELWLIGQLTTEVWYNSGGADFPFERLPGVFVEHGMLRGYSVASADVSVFWLGRDLQGQAIVFQTKEYAASRISTHAIEKAISSYTVVNDAIGFIYQQQGHTFYILIFPTANKTWVYDLATKLWHERAWIDENGDEHRIRWNCVAASRNIILAGDWENGKIYRVGLDVFTDDGDPIVRRRGFPHVVAGGRRVSYDFFQADVQCGAFPGPAGEQFMSLRWSDSGGAAWGNPVKLSLGSTGSYNAAPSVRNLGMARDRVFELFWDFPYETALQGAFIQKTVAET